MENHTDYSACALHELLDIALHIDKQRFPEKYSIVVAEIEKRQAAPDLDVNRPSTRLSIAGLIGSVVVEYGIILWLGIIWPIAIYNSPSAPATDMPIGLLLIPITALFFTSVAVCFALMLWALKPMADRELALRQSLKAVLWAPLSCVVLTPLAATARVALGFILPFGVPAEVGILAVSLAVAAPFVSLFWWTKQGRQN